MLSNKCISLDKYLPCKYQGADIYEGANVKMQKSSMIRRRSKVPTGIWPQSQTRSSLKLPWAPVPSRGRESKQDEGRFFCSRLVFQENKLLLQDNYVPSKIMVFQARSLFFKQNNCVSGKIIMFQADNCVSGKQALCLQGDDTWRVVGRISTNKWPARAEKNLANPFCKRLSQKTSAHVLFHAIQNQWIETTLQD